MLKILITSVGSLVGQNILDTLETRRQALYIVGLNTLADNPQMFRCDVAYLSPPTAQQAEFKAFLTAIIAQEKPDLILSARDQDTLFLAELRESEPALASCIPYATASLAAMSFQPWQTYLFAQSHNLPFVQTLYWQAQPQATPQIEQQAGLDEFVHTIGFPLIAKPARDSDAAAVRLVRHQAELEALLANTTECVLQEYLGDPQPVLQALERNAIAPALFYQSPDTWHVSCQSGASSPHGLWPLFCSYDQHLMGRSERFEAYFDSELQALAEAYLRAFAQAGGQGPFNLQCRRDRAGKWKAMALNLRFGGNTYSRWQSGHDELGYLIRAFLPQSDFPLHTPSTEERGPIVKTLRNWQLKSAWLTELEDQGKWCSPTQIGFESSKSAKN